MAPIIKTQSSIFLRRAVGGILVLAGVGGIASAQQTRPTVADVNGEWVGNLALEGGTHHLAFVFHTTDSTFAGTVYDDERLFGEMERGSFSRDTVKFFIDKLQFTCVIAGSSMKVALIVYNGSTRNFVMTRKRVDPGGGHASGG